MNRLPLMSVLVAATSTACTFEPPTRSAEWYENPQTYTDDSATRPDRARLQEYLQEAVAAGLPGVVMLVRDPVLGTWVGAAGFADLANSVPWEPSTLGRVGSVSKLFSATVILQLMEQGQLSLDDRLGELVSRSRLDGIANARQATIRQLLDHSSGIYDYLSSSDLYLEASGSYDAEHKSKEQLLEYARGEAAYFEPGDSWKYSNTNYLLLELVAEAVTGSTGPELLQALVIEPLGLRSTSYDPQAPPPRGLARGYSDLFADGALIDVGDVSLERFHFDGGVVSNVYDVADFLDAVMDSSFLSEAGRTALLDVVSTRGNSKRGVDQYGAGIILEDHPELGPIYGHLGVSLGFTAHAYRIVDSGVTFVAIVNGSQHTVEERSQEWFGPLQHDRIVQLVTSSTEE